MATELIDAGWEAILQSARHRWPARLDIVAPFIRTRPLTRLLDRQGSGVRVLTRFNQADFASAVSEIAALRVVLNAGGHVRGVRNLHAKLYIFSDAEAVITSANLTNAALHRNHEFGLRSDDPAVVSGAVAYFERLWGKAGPDLTLAQLADWEAEITNRLAQQPSSTAEPWPDHGVDVGLDVDLAAPQSVSGADRAFVKFLGEGNNRLMLSDDVLEEVRRSGAHWALGYPTLKRPRRVHDGDLMFIARMVQVPNDYRVIGRATGLRHIDERDVASEAEIALRPWKRQWPNYVRVSDARFVAGSLANGVSLYEMMGMLGYRAFRSTLENYEAGRGNTNPYQAIRQAPQVQLTDEAQAWMAEALEREFRRHGVIAQEYLDKIEGDLTREAHPSFGAA